MSTEFRCRPLGFGAVFGGDGISEPKACCLIAAKLSSQEVPRCIASEALMVRFGSLRVGDDSAVRLCNDLCECVFCENGVVAGVIGK